MSQNVVNSYKFGVGVGMTDAMVIGGNIGGTRQVTCETFDGSAWASAGNLGEARETGSSVGDSTNARYVNGYTINPAPYPNSNDNDEYNGTSWSADTVCPTTTNNVCQCHIGTVDLCRFVAGHANGTGNTTRNDSWNGTSWASATTQSLSDNITANGTQNDLLVINGGTGTYEWNGTSWSTGATVNVNRKYSGGAGGTSNMIACGGNAAGEQNTSSNFNGVSWIAGATMTTANMITPTASTPNNSTSMMICGGFSPIDYSDLTEVEELMGGSFVSRQALSSGRKYCGCVGISL